MWFAFPVQSKSSYLFHGSFLVNIIIIVYTILTNDDNIIFPVLLSKNFSSSQILQILYSQCSLWLFSLWRKPFLENFTFLFSFGLELLLSLSSTLICFFLYLYLLQIVTHSYFYRRNSKLWVRWGLVSFNMKLEFKGFFENSIFNCNCKVSWREVLIYASIYNLAWLYEIFPHIEILRSSIKPHRNSPPTSWRK